MSSSTVTLATKETTKGVEDLNQRRVESGTPKTLTVKAQKKNEEKRKDGVKQTYAELLAELKGTGELWEDPDFPAGANSLGGGKKNSYVWKRPKEVCGNPKLFVEGVSRFDVKQGKLGDCWLLAVVATLSLYEPLFENVVPNDQDFEENYIGAFRFRFWRFGTWCEVIVDDRLPTSDGKLVFMHSVDKNEFWSALLEKAYAKLSGSYEALVGGSQLEAMEDFTGGMCETIKLVENELPEDFFEIMVIYLLKSSLLGCAIESKKIEGVLENGLITGHAYSITGLEIVELATGEQVSLVRVRNPWGNEKEWNGKWSDKSSEWKTIVKEDEERILKITSFQNDGEFWMSYDDFIKEFTKLEICHLGPESIDAPLGETKRWAMSLENGSWAKNVNAGGCKKYFDSFVMNPQYRVHIQVADEDADDNKGTVIIGLMQKDMRKRGLPFYSIGYTVYEIKDPNCGILNKSTLKFSKSVANSTFKNQREVCEKHKLPPGHYVVIPSTIEPNQEADFLLRLFTASPSATTELDAENDKISVPLPLDTDTETEEEKQFKKEATELFKKAAGLYDVINASHLRTILNNVIGKDMKPRVEFDFEVCRSMIALFDDNCTGKMELDEFLGVLRNLQIWKAVFKEFDADNSGTFDAFEFRNALNKCGLSVSNAVFKVLVNRYSQPEEGVITFTDFLMAVIRLANAFETLAEQPRDEKNRLMFHPDEYIVGLLYM